MVQTSFDRLTFLGLYIQTELQNLSGLAGLTTLTQLAIDSCKRVGSIDEIAHLTNLTMLKVANCGDIASLAAMATLNELEEFFAWESTRVVDGDLSVLMTLPRLRQIAMASRRHYRPTTAELESALAARHG